MAVHLVAITSLPKYLVCELTIKNKKGYFDVMYRSPSQSSIEFESFRSGFEDMLSSVLFSKLQFTVFMAISMPDHHHGGQMTLLTLIVS